MAKLLQTGFKTECNGNSRQLDKTPTSELPPETEKAKIQHSDVLRQEGVSERNAWKLAMSDKGWWRLSRTPQVNHALPNVKLMEMGLYSLLDGYKILKMHSEPPYATHACMVV